MNKNEEKSRLKLLLFGILLIIFGFALALAIFLIIKGNGDKTNEDSNTNEETNNNNETEEVRDLEILIQNNEEVVGVEEGGTEENNKVLTFKDDNLEFDYEGNYEVSTSGSGGRIIYYITNSEDYTNYYRISFSSGSYNDDSEYYLSGEEVEIDEKTFKEYIYSGVSDFGSYYEYDGYDYGNFDIIQIASLPEEDILDPNNILWSSVKFK